MPMYPTQPLSPLSSVLAGMGHLADLSRIISNPRTGREQDSDALRDDWLAVGTDLRQAIHMYERINNGEKKEIIPMYFRVNRQHLSNNGGQSSLLTKARSHRHKN
jgi:hypothetical protein